jgi:RNA polymerase sigma factor (sigma-70 family)
MPVALGHSFDHVLSAARADAGWAYERLYRDLSPAVYGYFRVQGAREPEDLTSEVFLGAFRGLSRFTGDEARFRSWVFTIAHRRLTDERRRFAHRPQLWDGAHADPDQEVDHRGDHRADHWGGDVEEDALRRLSAERVHHLCHVLSPDQRDVLLLRLVSDLTLEATAGALDKTPGAVKSLQRRALIALRPILAREGVSL